MKERLAFKVQNGDKEKDDPQIVDLFSLSLAHSFQSGKVGPPIKGDHCVIGTPRALIALNRKRTNERANE